METSEWTLIEGKGNPAYPQVWRHADGREIVLFGNVFRTRDSWGELGQSASFEAAAGLRRPEIAGANILGLADGLALEIVESSTYEPATFEAALGYLIARRIEIPKRNPGSRDPGTRRKPSYEITLLVEGSVLPAVEQKAKAAFADKLRSVTKVERYHSRWAELDLAKTKVQEAREIVEGLRDEHQDWRDNLPENFQYGSKADELEDTISGLEDIMSTLEDINFDPIDFPDMC